LIKKTDDIHLSGKEAEGATRFICPRYGTIKDPLNLDNINRMKGGEHSLTKERYNHHRLVTHPNEEANLRGQSMKIIKTINEYPESGTKVVKTFDD
jgi:hypothetical protein